jgi:hypothetical protein
VMGRRDGKEGWEGGMGRRDRKEGREGVLPEDFGCVI